MLKVSKEVSTTLMVSNLLSTLLIIAIHYNSLGYINISHGFTWNYMVQQFITNGMARSAVPFFALSAGFFLFPKLCIKGGYRSVVRKRFQTLFIPYLIASALIFFSVTGISYLAHPERIIDLSLSNIAYSIIAHPIQVQFWFLRDLMFLVLLSPIILNLPAVIFNTVGMIAFFFWLGNIQPFPLLANWYFINIEVFFFFWLGAFVRKKNIFSRLLSQHKSLKALLLYLTIWSILLILRIYFDPTLNAWYAENYTYVSLLLYKMAIAIGVICIFKLSVMFKDNSFLIHLSGLTFFVYLFHAAPLSIVVTHITNSYNAYSFYINFPVAIILVFSSAHLSAKYLPSLYAVMTGGRTPGKSLKRINILNS